MNLLKALIKPFIKQPSLEEDSITTLEKYSDSLPDVRGKRGVAKLSDEQQLEFVHLIAQGLTPTQCCDKLYESTGIKVNIANYNSYMKAEKWKKTIDELKQQYRDRLDLIDGSHKSVRLRRMEAIMDKAVKKGDLRVAISANEQTRKEFVSEDGANIQVFWNNPVYQQLNTLSNDELIERHKKATEKLRSTNGPLRTTEEDKK